jgi:hypothetical protein
MSKCNILFLFIILNNNILHCMKRKQELTAINPHIKRQKSKKHSDIKNSPHFLIGDTSIRSLEYNTQKLAAASEIYNDAVIQIKYIDAIQTKNVANLLEALYQRPRNCHLESIVGLNFTQGACAVLENIQPTQSVLNKSLEIAFIKKNGLITIILLEKGARLTSPINTEVKKILDQNKEMKSFIISYRIELINPEKNFEGLLKILLTTTQLQQHVLNEYLDIATQQNNELLMTLLIKAGADITSCIN